MGYLFFQIWLWIIASFALGWVAHWLLCCRKTNQAESDTDLESPGKSEKPPIKAEANEA